MCTYFSPRGDKGIVGEIRGKIDFPLECEVTSLVMTPIPPPPPPIHTHPPTHRHFLSSIDCGIVGGLLVKAVRIHIGQVCAQLSW